jgi:flagellar motility protein MotE (MotC chaperone)
MASHLRFLPLVFIAVGGVLALRAVASLEAVPEFMKSATAWAEASRPQKAGPKTQAQKSDAKSKAAKPQQLENAFADNIIDQSVPASSLAAQSASATAKPAPICATSVEDMARQAGISPSELNVLQSLSVRRQQLDARERQLSSQGQLIEAADAKLDGRIRQMDALKAQIEGLLAQSDKAVDTDTLRMIKVYETMKPKQAAEALMNMSDEVRLPIAAKMKEAKLAAVLGSMPAQAAQELTEKLALRMKRSSDIVGKLAASASGNPNGAKATPKPADKATAIARK